MATATARVGYSWGRTLFYAKGGAAFEDSPLVKRNNYWASGVGMAWIIHQSKRLVDDTDD